MIVSQHAALVLRRASPVVTTGRVTSREAHEHFDLSSEAGTVLVLDDAGDL